MAFGLVAVDFLLSLMTHRRARSRRPSGEFPSDELFTEPRDRYDPTPARIQLTSQSRAPPSGGLAQQPAPHVSRDPLDHPLEHGQAHLGGNLRNPSPHPKGG